MIATSTASALTVEPTSQPFPLLLLRVSNMHVTHFDQIHPFSSPSLSPLCPTTVFSPTLCGKNPTNNSNKKKTKPRVHLVCLYVHRYVTNYWSCSGVASLEEMDSSVPQHHQLPMALWWVVKLHELLSYPGWNFEPFTFFLLVIIFPVFIHKPPYCK